MVIISIMVIGVHIDNDNQLFFHMVLMKMLHSLFLSFYVNFFSHFHFFLYKNELTIEINKEKLLFSSQIFDEKNN